MKKLLKRVQYFFYLRLRNAFEKVHWKSLGLQVNTPSGLQLFIKNRSDWEIYKEIFIRGDYDSAIRMALKQAGIKDKPVNFLDLGANVGFFTARFVDVLLQENPHMSYKGICVEGSLPVYKDLEKRFSSQPALSSTIQLVNGLAGKRGGKAKVFESGNTMTNSVISNSSVRRKLSGRLVEYINIDNLLNDEEAIHLLKCDIEGSEQEFLEHYPALLSKVNICVIELHHKKCDTAKCVAMIQASGMPGRQTIFNYGEDVSLEVFWRV